jgi:anti-anti-sigma factor
MRFLVGERKNEPLRQETKQELWTGSMEWYRMTTTEDNIALVSLNVESLVSDNVQQVRRSVIPALVKSRRILLDLGKLRYFDVTGFAEILRWVAQAKDAGEVRVCSKSAEVHALFELLCASTVVPFFWSREEALASFVHETVNSVHADRQPGYMTANAGGGSSAS